MPRWYIAFVVAFVTVGALLVAVGQCTIGG
jgi:hypothetical protein